MIIDNVELGKVENQQVNNKQKFVVLSSCTNRIVEAFNFVWHRCTFAHSHSHSFLPPYDLVESSLNKKGITTEFKLNL